MARPGESMRIPQGRRGAPRHLPFTGHIWAFARCTADCHLKLRDMDQVGVAGRRFAASHRVRTSVAAATLMGWALGLGVTSVILGTPYLLFAYHSPDLHLLLDSLDTGVALLVGYLLFGRYQRTGRLRDLLLADGLFLLALAGVGLTVGLHLLGLDHGRIDVWLPLALRCVGAICILAAAVSGARLVSGGWGHAARILPWAVTVAGVVLLWALRDQLPLALAQTPPASAERPVISGHPALLVAHAVTAACFAFASIRFAATANPRAAARDELLRWLGPAFALGAFARFNYMLFPSMYSDWLYTGDLLRTGCYLILLVGAAREISRYWSAQARAAVLEDRRRLARELHDGVVQELAFIRSQACVTTSYPRGERTHPQRLRPCTGRGASGRGRTGSEPRRATWRRPAPRGAPGRRALSREARGRARRLGDGRRRPASRAGEDHPGGRVERDPTRTGELRAPAAGSRRGPAAALRPG